MYLGPVKILVIQTAFIGDVILATCMLEKLNRFYKGAQLDILVQKGCESLFDGHPFIRDVIVFDKGGNRISALYSVVRRIRRTHYDVVVNVQRFFSSGLITVLSGATKTIGFNKNPLSLLFTERVLHRIYPDGAIHETQRDLSLISSLTDNNADQKPRLYPPEQMGIKPPSHPYVCIAPASLWYTKQWPEPSWIELVNALGTKYNIVFIGSGNDHALCQGIIDKATNITAQNLAGALSLLESARLMQGAVMSFVNDSAPLHLASAVNAPVTAIYCSTVPEYGFYPISEVSRIVQTGHKLNCRPCGLHGHKACPLGHFKCSEIEISRVAGKLL